MDNNLPSITHAIQLAVAPVFLLTGIAGMMNVLSSRLARVVDRRRFLLQREEARAEQDDVGTSAAALQEAVPRPAEPSARLARLILEDAEEIASLDARARLMYFSIFFAVFAALMVCLVVSTGFMGALTQLDLGRWMAGLFILSMTSMVASLVYFLREVYVAVVAGKMHRRA